MAEYKSIKGFKVQTVSTDPAVSNLGQVFYNSTANAFKVTKQSVPAGTWASGGNINTARKALAGAGDLTTALVFGGTLNPPTTLAETELYNGSSWTEVADLNTDRAYHGGSGTSTAALATGGSPTGDSPLTPSAFNEEWDGTSWTEVGDINTARLICTLFGWNRSYYSCNSCGWLCTNTTK
jgi:hypothetical protein